MYCPRPTQVLPAIVHPTQCCVTCSYENIIQPHVHPSHTTNVHHTNIENTHHFTHTESFVNEASVTDLGPVPGPPPAPTVAGAFAPGPGFAPGMMGPGMMGPEMMGPGMGAPGMMAPGMMGPGMMGPAPAVAGAFQPASPNMMAAPNMMAPTGVAGAYSGMPMGGYKKGCCQ
ncbi:spore coat protein CotD [Neobacillus piezotolerans]|uniref:Spore coat protein CotD n=1 Tax=Neobacillus piezotolerans TaxID=2259171 RepID=A0A3D8GRA8_9BACI|nr:CotD family spore coat protein [Neobacillus piezotolerans]RDU36867.1 spore coat protein CotD [Neobacillus piezotolerans]